MMITPEQIAETIAASIDGDWDDGLEAHISAAYEGNTISIVTESDDPNGAGRVLSGGFTVTVTETVT